MTTAWVLPGHDGYNAVIAGITSRIWGKPRPMTTGPVLAVLDGDNLLGACLFHNWQPDAGVIELTSASLSARWLTRAVLRKMFGYPFDELRCQAVVLRVDPDNAVMCRMAQAFGFKRYDVPRLRGRDKAEALFVLGDDDWRASRFCKENAHG